MDPLKLGDLDIQQLTRIKQTLDQELEVGQAQCDILESGRIRFEAAKEAIEELHEARQNEMTTSLLIPLTQSVYQKGFLGKPDRYVVDIGAGYHIERKADASIKYLSKRIQSVKDQVEKVSESLGERRRMQEFVTVQLQSKIGGA